MTVKTPRNPPSAAQSATSLPIAPADDAGVRVRNYLLTMGIRIACLVLMVFVQPYGWYSFVFAAGAIFLPYFAVVGANAASGRSAAVAVRPDAAAIDAPPTQGPRDDQAEAPTVIRIVESPAPAAERSPGDGAPSPDPTDRA
ncbi:DUF3099 domain-containing protein [Microbacterium sp. NPDC096154]|uniref:DUF3099 domain-containing protein n=1 Tax=Microbacterium sp. NPDC096154 TaxID=3155549 RepID=UPI00332C2F47